MTCARRRRRTKGVWRHAPSGNRAVRRNSHTRLRPPAADGSDGAALIAKKHLTLGADKQKSPPFSSGQRHMWDHRLHSGHASISIKCIGGQTRSSHTCVCVCVCARAYMFIAVGPITKLYSWNGAERIHTIHSSTFHKSVGPAAGSSSKTPRY